MHNRRLQEIFFPVVVMFNSIPVVAKAPILVLIMGNGVEPKIAIAALVCFFPTLVNSVRGLEAVNPQAMELMRVLSASRARSSSSCASTPRCRILFSALRIAASMSVIGAVVGEWIGATQGIGAMIIQATYNFDSALLYAAITMSACLSGSFFMVIVALERVDHPLAARSRLIAARPNVRFGQEPAMTSHDIGSRAARDVAVVAQADVRGGRRRPGRHGRGARGGAQRRVDRAARTLQPPRRPGLGRHGAGARRHVGRTAARDLGARHLPRLIERLAARDLAAFPRQHEWGIEPAAIQRWTRWGAFDFHTQDKPHPIVFAAAFDPDGWKRVALEMVARARRRAAAAFVVLARAGRGRPHQRRGLRHQERARGDPRSTW